MLGSRLFMLRLDFSSIELDFWPLSAYFRGAGGSGDLFSCSGMDFSYPGIDFSCPGIDFHAGDAWGTPGGLVLS